MNKDEGESERSLYLYWSHTERRPFELSFEMLLTAYKSFQSGYNQNILYCGSFQSMQGFKGASTPLQCTEKQCHSRLLSPFLYYYDDKTHKSHILASRIKYIRCNKKKILLRGVIENM